MPNTSFRQFCFEQWIVHFEECKGYDGEHPDYNFKEYFRRMKWFLRYQWQVRHNLRHNL